ncbi:MAG: hypothetical protein COC22_00460 [Flavobacteriaceae bacterium]|nr:MAG: hypothetical protein COC22_00460 [Flavobacteriaceae bacterium]
MQRNPLISIITVCFNAEDFIEQCIQSVISQKFEDFEYIVIDGGSTDKTTDIITKYEAELSYWHSQPDRGISHAFNQGIKKATGDWIVFLNADDCYLDSQVLSTIEATLRKSGTMDLVYGQVQIVKRQSSIVPISPVVGEAWDWKDFRLRSTIPHPSAFTHKHFFERYGVFDESFRNALDYELYLRAGRSLKTVFVPTLLTWMRDGGMSKNDAYRSYRESKKAQLKNGALNKVTAWTVYVVYAVRLFISQLVRRS